jgi:DNA modification methylase
VILQVEHGDLRDILPQFPEACIDACVTDPPYHLTPKPGAGTGFMGRDWDGGDVAFDPETWRHVWRALKPGAYLCAFGGTRTWHRIAVGIEDAGFEIRDSLAWLYGQGFPKSLNISKAIDAAAGAEREVVGQQRLQGNAAVSTKDKGGTYAVGCGLVADKMIDITAPATELARKWEGWGTALKPSLEPIILARKPPVGTIAANVEAFGVGGLNIGACRTPAPDAPDAPDVSHNAQSRHVGILNGGKVSEPEPRTTSASSAGRWPPNVCVDEDVAEDLDELFGTNHKAGKVVTRNGGGGKIFNATKGQGAVPDGGYSDNGGVSRYFYCPKANGKERDAGLEAAGWPALTGGQMTDRDEGAPGATNPRSGAGRGGQRRNPHPTVKPLELMRWLCRLVTPPGGIILDPFTGSGTTGCAAALEGFQFAGVELIELHAKLARDRIAYWAAQRAA